MFNTADFNEKCRNEAYDRMKVVVTQPYKKGVQFGLTLLKVGTTNSVQTATKSMVNLQIDSSPQLKIFRDKHFLTPTSPQLVNEFQSRTDRMLAAAQSKMKARQKSGDTPATTSTQSIPFDKEVEDFLNKLDLTNVNLENACVSDYRHLLEKQKRRKLLKMEKKVFFDKFLSFASDHLSSQDPSSSLGSSKVPTCPSTEVSTQDLDLRLSETQTHEDCELIPSEDEDNIELDISKSQLFSLPGLSGSADKQLKECIASQSPPPAAIQPTKKQLEFSKSTVSAIQPTNKKPDLSVGHNKSRLTSPLARAATSSFTQGIQSPTVCSIELDNDCTGCPSGNGSAVVSTVKTPGKRRGSEVKWMNSSSSDRDILPVITEVTRPFPCNKNAQAYKATPVTTGISHVTHKPDNGTPPLKGQRSVATRPLSPTVTPSVGNDRKSCKIDSDENVLPDIDDDNDIIITKSITQSRKKPDIDDDNDIIITKSITPSRKKDRDGVIITKNVAPSRHKDSPVVMMHAQGTKNVLPYNTSPVMSTNTSTGESPNPRRKCSNSVIEKAEKKNVTCLKNLENKKVGRSRKKQKSPGALDVSTLVHESRTNSSQLTRTEPVTQSTVSTHISPTQNTQDVWLCKQQLHQIVTKKAPTKSKRKRTLKSLLDSAETPQKKKKSSARSKTKSKLEQFTQSLLSDDECEDEGVKKIEKQVCHTTYGQSFAKAAATSAATDHEDIIECPKCKEFLSLADIEVHSLMCGDTSDAASDYSMEFGDCPICGAQFPVSVLQSHAAYCGT